ncbi:MAG: MFS transporter [Chloroflexi bacterium]|nr:MFS transporter [Chloroflexota bacterium]
MTIDRALQATSRRLTITLFIGQGLALAALFTTISISSIAGVQLAGTERVAGWPSTATLIGGSLAAYPAGRIMGRFGRRIGLSIGYAVGIVGGLLAGAALMAQSFPLFLVSMVLLGAARAASDQARYAAADVSPAHLRARAVSMIVFAGTIGAVFGPLITPIAGRLSESLGYDKLVGPWFINAALFVITLIFINFFLRPDPKEIATRISTAETANQPIEPLTPARSFGQVLRDPAVRVALIALGLAQTTMVMVMNITPVHMTHFEHGLDEISFVISMHILGMYGLSPLTGWISDRWGRQATIGLGAIMLIGSCLLAPTNPDTIPLAASLFLLGLGWNFCFVAGSSLLTDRLQVNERARIQGASDLVVSIASAIGSLSSGEIMARVGFSTATVIGMGISLIVLAAALATNHRSVRASSGAAQPQIDSSL